MITWCSDERDNWVCEYEFHVHQAMTMLQDAGPTGNALHTYPVHFPVLWREREDSDFVEPYYTDCAYSLLYRRFSIRGISS